ncbi:hypothetical protein SOVF_023150 [Spinacia oleracea]|nr:hypothetical protein SOVF_023150 [Spinacia oleracea]
MVGLIIINLLQSATHGASSTDNNNSPRHLKYDCYYHAGFPYSTGSTFEENLNNIFPEISDNASRLSYSKRSSNDTGIDKVFVHYYCRGNIVIHTCHRCVEAAVNTIRQKCKFRKQAIIWYEECTFRYANHTISSLDEEHPDYVYTNTTSLVSERLNPYRQDFDDTMNSLINDTAYNGNPPGFSTKEVNLSELSDTLRGLEQCSPFISSILCEKCLKIAFNKMDLWSKTMVYLPSCFIRFDIFQLSSLPSPSPNPGHTNSTEEAAEVETNSATGETNIEEAWLQLARFTYSQVKDMTNDFNRKLGEGGYGIVYYGRLNDDHREVAVKVLSNDAPKQFTNEAKVADFGFSKIFPAEYVSKLETRVIGTTGYLDPQYHLTGQVNEKSDVYSFGIVLFELITGKSAIIKYTNTHLVQWVTPLYERGDIGSILDPRIRVEVGENYNTIWRATELAKQCVELDAAHRPTMSNIVIELRECLAMENVDVECSSSVTTTMEMMTAPVSTTSMGPQPR